MNGSRYVLIVDDDADIRDVLSMVLATYGFRVETAADGFQALDRMRTGPIPDVVVVDLRMPGLNGEELLGRMRLDALLRDVPVLVMSGDGTARERAEHLDVAGCLVKPVDLDVLVEALERSIRREGIGDQGVPPP